MSKSMKVFKVFLVSCGIKPTNRNARRYLHCYRKHERMIRANEKMEKSLVPRYKMPY